MTSYEDEPGVIVRDSEGTIWKSAKGFIEGTRPGIIWNVIDNGGNRAAPVDPVTVLFPIPTDATPDWQKLTNELDELRVELWYPRQYKAQTVRVGLIDVRAADELVIRFDFDRDGWVICMDATREQPGFMEVVEPAQEVAFIPAWNEVPPVLPAPLETP